MAEHVRLKVDKSQLLCRKGGCGFFGNPEWSWYCSKCWRELNAAQQMHNHNFDSAHLVSLGSSQSLPTPLNKERPSPFHSLIKKGESSKKGHSSLSQKVSYLEDQSRKHVQTLERKTSNMKQMFRKGRAELDKSRSPTRADKPNAPPEAKIIGKEFADYLKSRVRGAGITDLSRNIQSFIDKVHKRVEILPIEEISAMVQNFYQALAKRLETHENFSGLSEEERNHISDLTERYIMICCYKQLFCPTSTQDEEKDLEIQERIRSLNWVTAAHLECPFSETNSGIRDLIYQAINDILQLDGSPAPQDKLASVVSCAKKIFTVIQAGDCSVASADDFLPSMIFILLKANPPRLISNINFITRFSNEARLRSGEEGYYFTNLCCGLNFVESLTAASLNLSQAEFDSFMRGEIPAGCWGATLLMCEGVQSMNHNLATLAELAELQARVTADCARLEQEMEQFQAGVAAEVEQVMARTAFTIRGPRQPVTVDQLAVPEQEEQLLPPPLLPQQVVPAPAPALQEFTPDPAPPGTTTDQQPTAAAIAALPAYVGFSLQSASIQSISCNTAASDSLLSSPCLSSHRLQSPSPQPSQSSFTPSSTSSSLHSLSPSPH